MWSYRHVVEGDHLKEAHLGEGLEGAYSAYACHDSDDVHGFGDGTGRPRRGRDSDGPRDVEFSDLYWVEDEDGEWEICYDVTHEYEGETEETFTECEDAFWDEDDFE